MCLTNTWAIPSQKPLTVLFNLPRKVANPWRWDSTLRRACQVSPLPGIFPASQAGMNELDGDSFVSVFALVGIRLFITIDLLALGGRLNPGFFAIDILRFLLILFPGVINFLTLQT